MSQSGFSQTHNLESEVMRGLGVTFCHWIFLFSHSKASNANIGIIANFVKNPNCVVAC